MAESFANQAAVALELFDARADQQRLTVLEDRDRIARDLHDHVIQRLFATALSLQASTSTMPNGEPRARLSRAVDDIDDTIKQIRSTIFDLRENMEPGLMRQVVVDLIKEFSPLLGFTPSLRFVGPVDVVVGAGLLGDAEAVLRETLANIVKHAHATDASIAVGSFGRRTDHHDRGRRPRPAHEGATEWSGQPDRSRCRSRRDHAHLRA